MQTAYGHRRVRLFCGTSGDDASHAYDASFEAENGSMAGRV